MTSMFFSRSLARLLSRCAVARYAGGMKLFAPLLLTLAACSPAPDATTNLAEKAPDTTPGSPLPSQDDAATAAAAPRIGELRTFRDWTVGCDNIGNCKAVALAPEDDAGNWPAFLPSIERDAGTPGAMRIAFAGESEIAAPIVLRIDGAEVARGGTREGQFEGSEARRIAEAMANAQAAEIESAGQRAQVSLAGVSAALRYIDAQQGRAGTGGAIVAKGGRIDNAAASPMPVIRALAPSGTAETLDAAAITRLQEEAGCEIFEGAYQPDPQFHALGGGVTLALVPCGAGAYNAIHAAFVIERGATRAAPFDAVPNGFGEDGAPTLINAGFEDGELAAFAKGRGLGDCGVIQRYVWDGTRFRIVEQSEMGECRGSTDYITTYRARIER
ncbi:DUF1176 domain-containing protein [Sphingomonas baiyangensis]|nr:DUF1176 domain-containing protein [Sphingomonas baiyangensis]